MVVFVCACVSAVAALLGAPLLALVAGFVAVALAVDYTFPATGDLRTDSQHAFERLAWQRRRETLAKRRPRFLELLPSQLEQTAGRRHLGVHPIPLDSIIGTIEPDKARAFDHAFRPPRWSRGRWELMWMAAHRGESLPPISVYRLHGKHFVIDGHHRVPVARSLDAAAIDADVIELRPINADAGTPNRPSPARHPLVQPRVSMPDPSQLPSKATATKNTAWAHGWLVLPVFLVIGLALTLLSGVFATAAGYVLSLIACAFIGRGLGSPLHAGLKDHRQ